MDKLFGTDGMRGEAGKFPLDPSTVRSTGRSLGRYLQDIGHGAGASKRPLMITGRDTRESGQWIEEELVAGATEKGVQCLSAGIITTPGVAFLTADMHANAGVVISASHNPYKDNGIKIFASSGRKLDETAEQLIERHILSNPSVPTTCECPKRESVAREPATEAELVSKYLRHLFDDIAPGLTTPGLKMVIDCGNGAASELAPAFFGRFGGTVLAINHSPNGRNINLNCGSLNMAGLAEMVVAEHADIGVAFDGDADRALFVNSDGALVDGDATLWIMAGYLQRAGRLKKQVVATVMSNIGLEIALRTLGLQLLRTDVGDKYVLEEILRTGAVLGGEQSGHIIFPDQSFSGDGMITTINILRAMTESGLDLKALTKGFDRYPQVLLNVGVRQKRPFSEVPDIVGEAREIDRKLDGKGRLLLRYSGTESLARVMIEGESQMGIEEMAEGLASTIRKNLG